MEANERYGHLVTLYCAEQGPMRPGQSRKWMTRCDCGREKAVRISSLRSGNTTSCGCWTWNKVKKHGRYKDPLYHLYHQMRQRCANKNHVSWAHYGARGITVCPAWDADFFTFERDMGPRPSPRHELDRIDNDGNYEPGNVRWAERRQQMANTRKTRLIEHDGETLCLSEWARRSGVPLETLRMRLNAGWTTERALVPGDTRKLPRPHRRKKVTAPG